MKTRHLSTSLLTILTLASATLVSEAQSYRDYAPPSLGGGQIYRTQARPVNTGNLRTGVQIQGGRVLLTHNGGRWVQDNVHVANISGLGQKRQSTTALVTVVPHRFPGQPPQNLMSVSGNRWFQHQKAGSTNRDQIIHTVSPPAELTPRKYPQRTTTQTRPERRKKGKLLSKVFRPLFGRKKMA